MPFSVPSARTYPWDVPLSRHLAQLNDPIRGGINTWTTLPTVGVDGLALGVDHAGYTGFLKATDSIIRWNGSQWVTLIDGVRTPDSNELSLYVNQATGNDANDGFTSSTAWKTISKFYQQLANYNLLERQVNLYLGAGSYIIDFPPSTVNGFIRVIGQSSSVVNIQSINIARGQTVVLQGVKITYPQLLDSAPFMWSNVSNNSTLSLGSDCVLGPIGNFISGYSRFHFVVTNSSVYFNASCPITVTGNVNYLILGNGANLWCSTYYNPTQGAVSPSAPGVDKGFSYSSGITTGSSDTICNINFSGSRVVDGVFSLVNKSIINGPPGWKMKVNGTVTGKAYALTASSINGSTTNNGSFNQGIDYTSTISAGTKDADSTILYVGI